MSVALQVRADRMNQMRLPRSLLIVLISLGGLTGCAQNKEHTVDWFYGKDLPLQQAIDADDVPKLEAAIQAGASVNAKGKVAVNPLEYAIGHAKKETYKALLAHHADPNQRDQEGDNAVILAVRIFAKDPEYLPLAIKAGGDPNTRRPNADPILASFIAAHNIEGIRTLVGLGADPNARGREGTPLIVDASLTQDWDVLWTLLELGAKYDYTGETYTIAAGFKNFKATPPDSPLYRYKVQSWHFLTQHGITLPPLQ